MSDLALRLRLQVAQEGLENIGALIGELKRAGVETDKLEQEARQLGGELQQLGREQGFIESFKKLKTETQSAERAMGEAKTRAGELARELRATENPTQAQQVAFDKARKSARQLSTEYQQKRVALQQLRGQMQQAGISSKDLASHQTRLAKELEAARGKAQGLTQTIKATATAAGKKIPDPTPKLKEGLSQGSQLAGELRAELARLFTAAALGKFVKDSVQAVRQAEASFRGLEAVANHTGVGIGKAFAEAQKLAADGLMTVSDASKSLQNLLARGYNLDQAVEVLTRLKDAAAFNRAAHLDMSEAVLTATEGLKNENSTLVDNAGVTKNVAKMWEDYAKQLGKSAAHLTQAEKIQAEVNGILKETEAQAGNAQKALSGVEGQSAQLNKVVNELEVAFGAALIPALTNLATAGKIAVNDFLKPFLGGIEIMAIRVAATVESLDEFWDVLTGSGDEAAQAAQRIRDNFQLADEMAQRVVDRYEGGLIPAAQEAAEEQRRLGDAARTAGEKTRESADAATVAASALVEALSAAGGAGEKAGDQVKKALEAVDVTSIDGVRALGIAFTEAADQATKLDEAVAEMLGKLSDDRFAAFATQLADAYTRGMVSAQEFTRLNDAVLAESFKRLGLVAETQLGRISPAAQGAIASLDAIRASLVGAADEGAAKMTALGNAITASLQRADTPAAVEQIRLRIEAMGESGELAGQRLEEAMHTVRGRLDEVTPGINSVEEAFKKLGITSQAELRKAAETARQAYDTIRGGGTTITEQQQAWLAWAKTAIQSGDAATIALVRAEGSALGLTEQVVRLTGQQKVVGDATRDAAASLREQASNAAVAKNKLRKLAAAVRDTAAAQSEAAGSGASFGAGMASVMNALRGEFAAFGDEALHALEAVVEHSTLAGESVGGFFKRLAAGTERLRFEIQEEQRQAQSLLAQIQSTEHATTGMIDRAEQAADSFQYLGDEQLSPLRDAIASARAEMDALNDSASRTLDSLQDELDRLDGREEALAQRRADRRRAEIEAQLEEAKAHRNTDAIRDLEKSLKLADELASRERERAREAEKERAAREADRQSERRDADRQQRETRTTTTTTTTSAEPSRAVAPVRAVRIQFAAPSGRTASGEFDEASADALLRILAESGARTVN